MNFSNLNVVIVSDTTAISNLFKLEKLHYLKAIFQSLIIPTEVNNELLTLKEFGFNLEAIENSDWISVRTVEKTQLYFELSGRLDLGETEAIVLSQQMGTDFLIMDEKKGRIEAEKLGIKTVGILGILIQCRRAGIISNLKAEMDDLKTKAGVWISENLYQEVLSIEAKEFPDNQTK